ncbi:MAG: molybdenum cofactor guanylyltransferase [Sphingomonadales bacterium]
MGILGIILAGGKSSRMEGKNKALIKLGQVRLIDHVFKNLSQQASEIVINAPSSFSLNVPFCPDVIEGGLGPLSGVHASLNWLKINKPNLSGIVTVPVDCPFFSRDLVKKLFVSNQITLAKDNSGIHPVFGYWPICVFEDLERFLFSTSKKSVRAFAKNQGFKTVNFEGKYDFFNINSRVDLSIAEDISEKLKHQ